MAGLKLRVLPRLPASLTAAGGLAVSKENGIWTFEPDWSVLSEITVLDTPEDKQIWAYDPVTLDYWVISVQAFIDSLPAGPAGATGAAGAAGVTSGIKQTYSTTTTDADPGAGIFRLNNATPASATAAYLDNLDSGGSTVSGIIDLWDDSTTTTKGYLRVEKSTDPTKWAQFAVTGSVVDGTGYRKLTLTSGAGSGVFTNGDTFAISFFRSGDKGADGAGTGDFSSNTATSVDGEMVLFSGTAGKTGKRSTLTGGLLKSTSGVPAIATADTDYTAPATFNAQVSRQSFIASLFIG